MINTSVSQELKRLKTIEVNSRNELALWINGGQYLVSKHHKMFTSLKRNEQKALEQLIENI